MAEASYPLFIIKNPTPEQESMFIKAVKFVQGNSSQHFFDDPTFEKYGEFKYFVQNDDNFIVYCVKDDELYHKLSINPALLMKSLIVLKNNSTTTIQEDSHILKNMEMRWITANGETLDLAEIPLCTIKSPTHQTLQTFNDAVLQCLEQNGIYDLLAEKNGNNIDYFLHFRNIDDAAAYAYSSGLVSEKQLSIYAGISALEKINQEDKVIIYDETGKQTDNTSFYCANSITRKNKMLNEKIAIAEAQQTLPHPLSQILKNVQVQENYKPVYIKRILAKTEPIYLRSIIKKFNKNQHFSEMEDFDFDIKTVSLDDVEYAIVYIKGSNARDYCVSNSPTYCNLLTNNYTTMIRTYPIYTIDLSEKLRRAESLPLCKFNVNNLDKQHITEAVKFLQENTINTCTINTQQVKNYTIAYISRNKNNPKSSHVNKTELRVEKHKLLKGLQSKQYPFTIIDDNGLSSTQYKLKDGKSITFKQR